MCLYLTYSESVKDLPPNKTLGGISLDVYSEEEENEVFAILNQFGTLTGGDDEDDDSATGVFCFTVLI